MDLRGSRVMVGEGGEETDSEAEVMVGEELGWGVFTG